MKIISAIIFLLVLSSLIIIESNDLNIMNKEDMKTLSKKYLNWSEGIYENLQQITGQAIKLEWLPE